MSTEMKISVELYKNYSRVKVRLFPPVVVLIVHSISVDDVGVTPHTSHLSPSSRPRVTGRCGPDWDLCMTELSLLLLAARWLVALTAGHPRLAGLLTPAPRH